MALGGGAGMLAALAVVGLLGHQLRAMGSELLGGIALTLLVVDSHLVWLVVGLIGGAVVVGLPAFAATRPSVTTFRGPMS